MQFRITVVFPPALVFLLAGWAAAALAGPVTIEESEHRRQVVEQLKKALADETDEGKIGAFKQALADESDVDLRGSILDIAAEMPAVVGEAVLTERLTADDDAGLRSEAATALGKTGSEKCLAVLARAAAADRTTQRKLRGSCIVGRSSARRAATFALAELAGRFPNLADKAAAELRGLPVIDDPKDHESLWDARQQALYQITHDASLIQPFFDQLKSDDPKVRVGGLIAFRFLKLKTAPPQIVAALEDTDKRVRGVAAMVLGEIKDPQTVDPLMAVAADRKSDRGVRCNAIGALAHMRAADAGKLMETLLADPDESVSANAAVALYRITGKKTKQLLKGYNN